MVIKGAPALGGLRATVPDGGAVARSLLGVAAVAVPALHWGSGTAAVWATGAGAIAGAIALQDSPRFRFPLAVAAAAEMGLAVLLGALSSAYVVLFVAVVAGWCFAAGLRWSLGGQTGLVASATAALLVIAPPDPPTVRSVLMATGFTVAAALVQALLIVVAPPRRWRSRRESLRQAYRNLGDDARRVAADPQTAVNTAPLTWLRKAFADSPATRRPRAYQGGYRVPERLTAALSALSAQRSVDTGEDDVGTVLVAAASVFEGMARRGHGARADTAQALEQVGQAAAEVSGPQSAAVERLDSQLHEAVALRFGPSRRAMFGDVVRRAAAAVRAQLIWSSPILRHAVRLATATAAGVAIARYAELADGYWIALTVLLTLRPETAHTYTRCAGRIAAVTGGVALASALTVVWQPTGYAAAIVAAVFLGLTYAAAAFGYLAVGVTLSATVVFVLGIGGITDVVTVRDRLLAVVIGGALALLAHALLPDAALVRLRQRAGELLKAEIDYAAVVITAFVHPVDDPDEAAAAAWQRTLRARAAFEAAAGAARMTSPQLRRWLRSYRAALNAVTASCAALEQSVAAARPSRLGIEFVAAVDDFVDALCGDPPTPAAVWTIDTAQLAAALQQVRQVGAALSADDKPSRILVSEIGTITRQLERASTGDSAETVP